MGLWSRSSDAESVLVVAHANANEGATGHNNRGCCTRSILHLDVLLS